MDRDTIVIGIMLLPFAYVGVFFTLALIQAILSKD